jgi:Uma2 family endonuclease
MFPDYTVVCGPEELAPDDAHAIVNPTLVFEVSSPSTAATDRTTKADRYKTLASLRTLVLVWQDEVRVQVHRRSGAAWEVRDYGSGETALLFESGPELDVDALSRGVELEPD